MTFKFNLFIFDFDGTLVDSKAHISNCVNAALLDTGLRKVAPNKIHPTIGILPIGDTFKYLYPKLSSSQVEMLTVKFRERLLASATEELRFYPNVIDTLKSLKKSGKKLAILTTKKYNSIASILESLGIDDMFDVIYGSGMEAGNKPDKRTILYIVDKTDSKLEETVMIGDTSVDAQTAKNAEIASIGVAYGNVGKEGIKKANFNKIIRDFNQLLKFI